MADMKKNLVGAHRGAMCHAPENSLAAFEKASERRDRLLWVEVRVSRVSEDQEDGARDVGRRWALEEMQHQQTRELAQTVEKGTPSSPFT